MEKQTQMLLIFISVTVGLLQATANGNPSPNAINLEQDLPPSVQGLHHPIPPVAMQGILNDFEPSVISNGHRKQLLTDLRFLKNQMMTMDRPMTRKRRSLGHARPFPQALRIARASRNKRDLRRLRRDLGYEDPLLMENEYSRPSLIFTRKPELQRTIPQYQGSTVPDQSQEVNQLLRGLNFLEHLAQLTQSREIPPVVDVDEQRLYKPRGNPTRFAPQPKVILDEDIALRHPLKPEVLANWERALQQSQGIPEPLYWVPEKRWSRSRSLGSLSMVPGFKRSAFREATRTQREVQDEFEDNEKNEEILPLTPNADTEDGIKEKRIQEIAM